MTELDLLQQARVWIRAKKIFQDASPESRDKSFLDLFDAMSAAYESLANEIAAWRVIAPSSQQAIKPCPHGYYYLPECKDCEIDRLRAENAALKR